MPCVSSLSPRAVAKRIKTVYSNSPLLLTVCESAILPLSVSQAVASCQTSAVCGLSSLLLYYHTLCRGLAVILTLLCRLSSSHLTTCTTRSAKGQAGPSTCKREGDISQSYSCSNTMHAIRPAALHVSVAPYQSIARLHQPVASSDQSHRPRLG